jgi:transcriptional regulator with XRE-family HTH domain
VGDTLRGARVKAGLSLKSAAAKAGTNLTTVHFIERGQRVARTNFIVIVRLVRLYGISLDTLADAVIAEHANG